VLLRAFHLDFTPYPVRTLLVKRSLLVVASLIAAAPAAAQPTVDVPRVPASAPIMIDGFFASDEWADARVVPVAGSVRLHLKQVGEHVFIGVSTGTRVPRPVDLYLQAEDGSIHQLHASAQIGERHLPATGWGDESPAWRWGNHVDWIANEAKLDSERPRDAPFSARTFPSEGVEFQIRRSRYPGREWKLRVDVGYFPGNEGSYRYPERATDDPASWMRVRLP